MLTRSFTLTTVIDGTEVSYRYWPHSQVSEVDIGPRKSIINFHVKTMNDIPMPDAQMASLQAYKPSAEKLEAAMCAAYQDEVHSKMALTGTASMSIAGAICRYVDTDEYGGNAGITYARELISGLLDLRTSRLKELAAFPAVQAEFETHIAHYAQQVPHLVYQKTNNKEAREHAVCLMVELVTHLIHDPALRMDRLQAWCAIYTLDPSQKPKGIDCVI